MADEEAKGAVFKTPFDVHELNKWREIDGDYRVNFEDGAKFSAGFDSNTGDLFSALYQKNLVLNEGAEESKVGKFIKSLQETEDFKSLRETTKWRGGESWSAMKKLAQRFYSEGQSNDPVVRRIAARKAAKEARNSAEEYAVVAGAAGCGQNQPDGEPEVGSGARERMMLANKLVGDPFIKKIMLMAGRRVNQASHAIATKADRGYTVPQGVEFGNDLERLVFDEVLAELLDPKMFKLRYIMGECMQYQLGGTLPQGYGPILFICDQSGSMRGAKRQFCASFQFALWTIAKSQRREFHVINFGTRAEVVTIKTTQDMIRELDRFMGANNTYFEPPLLEVIRLLDEAKAKNTEMKTADAIFVSDGMGKLSQGVLKQFLEKKKSLSFKVLSAMITDDEDRRRCDVKTAMAVLKQFSDQVFHVNDVMKSDEFVKTALNGIG